MKKLDITHVRNSFETSGYKLLSKEYINSSKKLSYICPNGHEHSISWDSWRSGHRCPYCSNVGKPSITYIRDEMLKEGYKLLSNRYINAKTKLEVICPVGHNFSITWSNWSNKSRPRRCPECAGTKRKDIDYVRSNIVSNGYNLVSNVYKNAKDKLELVCPNGHTYTVSWDNWYTKNNRCPKCGYSIVSKHEKDIMEFIKSFYSGSINENARDVIKPYELDIVLPDIKLAIEYCGLYWHSELFNKNKDYHINKLLRCNKKGYRLITIFEDEYLNSLDIVKSKIKHLIGNCGDVARIYARKCLVKEITTSQAREFCEQNHLQGYTGSSIKLGLFYDENLVSVMTFSKQSIAKGSKNIDGYWELSRFCNKIDHQVVGGASKLLKFFERNYSWINIISYADRRWSDGGMYYKIGFSFDGFTKPNYWYFHDVDRKHRIHRFSMRKREYMKNTTERSYWLYKGYHRIWDCGNYKFTRSNI